jgi:hypothetical protein
MTEVNDIDKGNFYRMLKSLIQDEMNLGYIILKCNLVLKMYSENDSLSSIPLSR